MDPENHWLVEENNLPGGQDVRVYVSFRECTRKNRSDGFQVRMSSFQTEFGAIHENHTKTRRISGTWGLSYQTAVLSLGAARSWELGLGVKKRDHSFAQRGAQKATGRRSHYYSHYIVQF